LGKQEYYYIIRGCEANEEGWMFHFPLAFRLSHLPFHLNLDQM